MLQTIIDLVKETRSIIFAAGAAHDFKLKGHGDYVTVVDTGVQNFLQERLFALYPEIQFMGEEKNNDDIDFSGRVWILDPIDGTANLVRDFGQSAVSLALVEGGRPTHAVIYNPFTDELYAAERGKGATLNGCPIHVTSAERVADSLIAVGTCPYHKELGRALFTSLYNVWMEAEDIRRIGAAALDLCHVAAGRADGMFEHILNPWDIAAGILLIEEAGGKVTDMDGAPLTLDRPNPVLATNGKIHEELQALLIKE